MFVADRVAVRECPARFLYTGSHKKNHPDTDCVAVDRAGVGRAPQGRRVGAKPGALVGGAAGGLVGAIWGGISGLMRAAVATDAKDAAIGGAKAGAVGGALGGAGRAYGAVRALGASSKLVASAEDLANVNKIRHVFGQSKHLLGQLASKYGPEQAAYKALQDAVVKEVARRGITSGVFKDIEVVLDGQRILVRGWIDPAGIVRIGTAFTPRGAR